MGNFLEVSHIHINPLIHKFRCLGYWNYFLSEIQNYDFSYLNWIIGTRDFKNLRTSEGFNSATEFAITCITRVIIQSTFIQNVTIDQKGLQILTFSSCLNKQSMRRARSSACSACLTKILTESALGGFAGREDSVFSSFGSMSFPSNLRLASLSPMVGSLGSSTTSNFSSSPLP